MMSNGKGDAAGIVWAANAVAQVTTSTPLFDRASWISGLCALASLLLHPP